MKKQLRPYQQDAVQSILENYEKGINKQIIVMATGLGKEQPISEPVLTPDGWTTMGDIKVGDEVVGSDGLPKKVISTHPQGIKEIYKITFSDRSTVRCGWEHLWSVQTKSQKHKGAGFVIKKTEELFYDLFDRTGANKWFLPLVEPIEFTAKDHKIHPYVLGYLIASEYQTVFSPPDEEALEQFQRLLPDGHTIRKIGKYGYRIVSENKQGVLKKELVRLGLMGKSSHQKFIPTEYLYDSVDSRIELLRGLMDCAGTVPNDGCGSEYTTSSQQLANEVCELVRSLGGVTEVRFEDKVLYTYKDERKQGRVCYRVMVSLKGINCFYIGRKAEKYNLNAKQGQTKAIVNIEKDGEEEAKCIYIDSSDHLYVTNGYTLTHNTVVFSHLIAKMVKDTGKKALVLAHRKELLEQAKDKLQAEAPELKIEIEQGENHASSDCDVVIASVQTIGKSQSVRLGKWNPEDFCIAVADEGHHAPADTYRNVFRWLGCLKAGTGFLDLNDNEIGFVEKHGINIPLDDSGDWNKNILLLGVTATPNRMDNKGVNTIFDKQTFAFDLKAGVEAKALVRPRGRIVRTKVDISKVKQQQGDFQVKELAEAIDTPERNALVVKAYLDNKHNIPFQKALVFATDVKHTQNLCQTFLDHGIPATYVVGTTPKEERAQRLADFRSGKVDVMVNAMVLTEGYDNEFVGAIFNTRPTRSGILYMQMIGRGTRPVLLPDGTHSPLKTHIQIFDFVDITSRHDVKTISHIINIDQPIDFGGKDIFEYEERINDLLELAPNTDLSKIDLDKIDYAIQEVDLLAGLAPSKEVTTVSRYDWQKITDDFYKLNLGTQDNQNISYLVQQNQIEEWEIVKTVFDKTSRKNTFTSLEDQKTLKNALRYVDQEVREQYPDSIRLIDSKAAWRLGHITEAQIKFLRKAGVPEVTISQMNKGDAVRLLNKLWSQRR